MSLDRDAPARLLGAERVVRVLDALDAPGEETRIVGGAVRNALLGRPVQDIDLATTAAPEDTLASARHAGLKAVPTGLPHGTVTVVASGRPFEVTTLREDIETDGRHAVVRFGRDFAADAIRRDFTVNALSLDRTGRIHDYAGGLADLEAGRVRFIGDADTRIREDYLRILRFFRFSAEYAAGRLDPAGFAAAIRHRDGLDRLSAERVRAEVLKLLAAERAPEIVGALQGAGLLSRIAGGVGDVGRLGRAVKAGLDPIGRLAALLCFSAADAARLRARLRLSNAETAALDVHGALLASLRSIPLLDEGAVRRHAVLFGPAALATSLAILRGEPRPALSAGAGDQLARFAAGEPAPRFPLAASDLLAAGVPAGPALGRRLRAEKDTWMAAGCPSVWTIHPEGRAGAIAFVGWDEAKHARNQAERGFGFDIAARIFEGDTIEQVDRRHATGEVRVQAIGIVDGETVSLVYTDRGATRWIISARRASRAERRQWNER